MNSYEARKAEKADRLRERAAKKQAASDSAYKAARSIMNNIPMGQPVLVGHHSERRHRADLARVDRSISLFVESGKEARRLAERADTVENRGAIDSDDPEALDKLRERIAELEAKRDGWKAKNAELKKAARAGEPVPAERYAQPYQFSNLGANIRRLKKRVEMLDRTQEAATKTEDAGPVEYGNGVSCEVDTDAGRIYFHTPGRNEEATKILRRAAWVWARSVGCWSRKITPNAMAQARYVGPELAKVYA